MLKVKDIPSGSIVWGKNKILGIKDFTLDEKYNENDCQKLNGNSLDYEIVSKED